jgi:hypothetical protein
LCPSFCSFTLVFVILSFADILRNILILMFLSHSLHIFFCFSVKLYHITDRFLWSIVSYILRLILFAISFYSTRYHLNKLMLFLFCYSIFNFLIINFGCIEKYSCSICILHMLWWYRNLFEFGRFWA